MRCSPGPSPTSKLPSSNRVAEHHIYSPKNYAPGFHPPSNPVSSFHQTALDVTLDTLRVLCKFVSQLLHHVLSFGRRPAPVIFAWLAGSGRWRVLCRACLRTVAHHLICVHRSPPVHHEQQPCMAGCERPVGVTGTTPSCSPLRETPRCLLEIRGMSRKNSPP